MDARVFRSFVKTAMELQLKDENMPEDYLAVHSAVLSKYPSLQKAAAFPTVPALETAGLGILAAPGIKDMASSSATPEEKRKARWETAGLGVLAAHPIYELAQHMRGR